MTEPRSALLPELQQIAEKHGYVFSHDFIVYYHEGPITHYCFRHTVVMGADALLLGIWKRGPFWYFDAHKSGGVGGSLYAYKMDQFLKGHVARAKRKLSKPGHCIVCGRNCTKHSWLKDAYAQYGNVCSQLCNEMKGRKAAL